MDSIVRQIAIWKNSCMSSRPLRHIPTVHFVTIVVDKSDGPRTSQMAVKHITRRHCYVIDATKTNAAAEESVLFHS